jgi:Rrf2 family iron-sulfur cluster assembly transcriptional regulator
MGATGCRADRSKCLTHDLWEELGNQIHTFLSSVTLLDVLERKLSPRIVEAPTPAAAKSDAMAAAS